MLNSEFIAANQMRCRVLFNVYGQCVDALPYLHTRVFAAFHTHDFPRFFFCSSGIEEKRVPCRHFKIRIRYSLLYLMLSDAAGFVRLSSVLC